MKVIICNTPFGQYLLPLQLIAEDRADYYACKVDGYKKNSKEWQEEADWVMDDYYECIDWLLNSTDWDDWKDKATKLNDRVFVSEGDFWTCSDDFKIEEK
jgi:hypothetical protein